MDNKTLGIMNKLVSESDLVLEIYDKMYNCDDKPMSWPSPDILADAISKAKKELSSSHLGMYGENPIVEIGKITIAEFQLPPDGTVWMDHQDGDGMQASKELLSLVLEKFYNANF